MEDRVHSLKERMMSEEQVGRKSGRIPFRFQRIVPAGETFPAISYSRTLEKARRTDMKKRGSFFSRT